MSLENLRFCRHYRTRKTGWKQTKLQVSLSYNNHQKQQNYCTNFSTSCSRHLEATAGVVVGPLLPPPAGEVQEHLCKLSGGCGKSKPPCKQPPGPCEVRRQKEEEKRKEKAIHIPPKPKKASQDANRMVLRSEMDQDVRLVPILL